MKVTIDFNKNTSYNTSDLNSTVGFILFIILAVIFLFAATFGYGYIKGSTDNKYMSIAVNSTAAVNNLKTENDKLRLENEELRSIIFKRPKIKDGD